jgi:hypothetical protein
MMGILVFFQLIQKDKYGQENTNKKEYFIEMAIPELKSQESDQGY